MLIGMVSMAQENIGTMAISFKTDTIHNVTDTTIHVYFKTLLDTSIHSTNEYTGKFFKIAKLQPQLNDWITIIKHDYKNSIGCNYQNVSFSGIDKERFWITYKNGSNVEVLLEDLSDGMKQAIYLSGIKIINVIKEGNYEN